MSKRRILYSDIPHPYDEEAARLAKIVGLFLLACIGGSACLLFFSQLAH